MQQIWINPNLRKDTMVKIKICGLKTLADVEIVNKYKPEYIGFVFAPTKRFVTDEQALAMRNALDKDIKSVGVFVNEPIEHIVKLCNNGTINLVQLHGDESEDYIRKLKSKLNADIEIIKAVRVQNQEQVQKSLSNEADYMLFDTYKKGEMGGTGERFPLEILEQSLYKDHKPFFLAGGLSPDNIKEVLGQMECYCVDVSTGVEIDGVKDETKIKQFIENVRNI
jgi:phosphoribosylanthranilate isomerase